MTQITEKDLERLKMIPRTKVTKITIMLQNDIE